MTNEMATVYFKSCDYLILYEYRLFISPPILSGFSYCSDCHQLSHITFFNETELNLYNKRRWVLMGGFPASLWITSLKRATHRINVGWPDDSWYSSLPWIHVTAACCRVVFQRNLIIISVLQTSEERIWFISASEDLVARATKCSPVKKKHRNKASGSEISTL